MTLKKMFAAWLVACLFVPVITGQEAVPPPDSTRFSSGPMELFATPSDVDSAGQELAIPNVFTPNGDGVNDYFEVDTDGTTVYTFRIFTRSGTQIFYSRSPRIYWNGKNSSGTDVKAGIYYYVIEETGTPEPFEKAGFIHLFR
ncbi:MAG TPA: gliding motility-associated C-terminal domain-containing protein [Bacteroides sp.]|nr:gliding motility-associated C-terminal domain-containing protein [Bacteroides sp.]